MDHSTIMKEKPLTASPRLDVVGLPLHPPAPVTVVRKGMDAFNAFMREEPGAKPEAIHPQFEFDWHDERTYPDIPQHFRGVRELIVFWEHLRAAWADLAWEALEFIEVPDDRVVTLTRMSGRGRESGVPVEIHFFLLFTIRDGNLRNMEVFRHRADALEAAVLSENVELSLDLNDAWNRRDVDAVVALWDPEGMWYPALEGVTEGRAYRGHAGIRQYYEDLAEFSGRSDAEFPEVHDLGDQVLGLGSAWFRFASGVELDQEVSFLHTWRNGKCIEARTWLSHGEALEAAGLSE
jgi:ketosteroid isomerase-like protein